MAVSAGFVEPGTSQTDLPVNVNAKQLDTNTLQLDLVPQPSSSRIPASPKAPMTRSPESAPRWEANTPHMENLFDAIADCVENGLAAWTTHDMTRLGQTLTDNHHLLQQIGVSTPTLDHMVELALSHGAYGAKLTGGGGGGCILALTPEQPEALREAFFPIRLSSLGHRNTAQETASNACRNRAGPRHHIALIKYWGKRDSELNLPETGSLSLTLTYPI